MLKMYFTTPKPLISAGIAGTANRSRKNSAGLFGSRDSACSNSAIAAPTNSQ